MHTLTVNIEDSVLQEFLYFVSQRREYIKITEDINLENDPSFYERQKKLLKDIEEIDSTNVQMISNEYFWNDIDSYTKSLEK